MDWAKFSKKKSFFIIIQRKSPKVSSNFHLHPSHHVSNWFSLFLFTQISFVEFCQKKMKDRKVKQSDRQFSFEISIGARSKSFKFSFYFSFFFFCIFFFYRKNVFEMIARNWKKYSLTCCPLTLAPCFTFSMITGKIPEKFPSTFSSFYFYVASHFCGRKSEKKLWSVVELVCLVINQLLN